MFTALTGKRGLACMIDSKITRDVCMSRLSATGNEPALKLPLPILLERIRTQELGFR